MNYFKPEEFKCHCGKCTTFVLSDELVRRLNVAREAYGKPMKVTSGYRCPEYNAQVGGVNSSSHVSGEAADIWCTNGMDRFKMIRAFYEAGFVRIGIDDGFIHVDVSLDHPQNVAWVYYDED